MDEVYAIERLVKGSGLPFCVGHNRRSSPAIREGHAIFRHHMEAPGPCPWRFDREGTGRPKVENDGVAGISVRINDDWYSWKGFVFEGEKAEYGPLVFEMTHFTDLCNWFMAAEPEEVAVLRTGLMNSGVLIKYRTGELATIMMSANGTFGYPKELYEAMGQGGLVAVDHMVEVRTAGIEGAAARKVYPMIGDRHPEVGTEGGLPGWLEKKRVACREAAEKGDSSLIFTAEPDKGHARAIDAFVDEIAGEGAVVCGIDEAVAATRVAFAAYKAAQENRVVKMDEI